MRKHHFKNERIKRQYFIWLQEAKRLSPHSVDQAASAIALFEASTNWKDFAAFHIEQARAFKKHQSEAVNEKTGKPLAKATLKARFDAIKAFTFWLADQPGYRSKIKHSDSEYFNLSANDARIATAKREKQVAEVSQIIALLDTMKAATPFEKRSRALIAFALLTGARDNAIASLSLRYVDLQNRVVVQDARDVRTKNRKTFSTWFYPVGGQAEAIVADWIAYLKTDHGFTDADPLFPSTQMGLDADGNLAPLGFQRKHWADAGPIRKLFREAFAEAGLPSFNPHSFRNTLTQLGQTLCKTPEEFKAWSQNMGHDDVLTTLTSFGAVQSQRQAEIIRALGQASATSPNASAIAELEAVVARLKSESRAA